MTLSSFIYIYLSFHLPVCLSTYRSVCAPILCVSIHLPVYLLIYVPICLLIHPITYHLVYFSFPGCDDHEINHLPQPSISVLARPSLLQDSTLPHTYTFPLLLSPWPICTLRSPLSPSQVLKFGFISDKPSSQASDFSCHVVYPDNTKVFIFILFITFILLRILH